MNFPPPSDKQARIVWLSLTGLAIGVIVALLGVLLWGFGFVLRVLSPVIWPLAIAGIIAYLLDPVVDFFERRKFSRQKSIILVFGICVLCIGGLVASILPRVVREGEKLIVDLPAYAKNAQEDLNEWVSRKPVFDAWRLRLFPRFATSTNHITSTNSVALASTNSLLDTNAAVLPSQKVPDNVWGSKFSESVLAWLSEAAPVVGNWLWSQVTRVASWAGMIIGIAMVPVFTYYFLQEKEKIRKGWTNYLPLQESRLKEELVFVLNSINNYLIVFFRGQVLIAFCNGVMLTIGFLIMGLNYAVLLGLMAGMLSIVPYLGTVVTLVPTIILAAVQFRDLFHPVMVVVIFSVVHLMEGFVISPKIMGDRVGLHPLTIIVAVLVGTTLLGGILGGILAIPLTAALRVVMFRYVWKPRSTEVVQ
ncbi:MAG: hypothetical protein JWM16_4680 [Verrucomicrobiales bacterium]|nr:hypothetical protein [Verrucomicrobiales bacterium]